MFIRFKFLNEKGGNGAYCVYKRDCEKLKIVEGKEFKLPKNQTGKNLISETSAIQHFLSGQSMIDFVTSSRMECLIFGQLNQLRNEIKEKRVAFHISGNKHTAASLQEVLRVKKFMGDGHPYRSEIYNTASNNQPVIDSKDPFVVIFDGAQGYLKWKDAVSDHDAIVILNRCGKHSEELADSLNKEYTKRVDSDISDIPSIPPGLELMVYREERRK
jgi:hypothetical protein